MLSGSEWLDHAKVPPAYFVFASVGILPEGYGRDGPGVWLGDGQKVEGVLSRRGWGDALVMPHYLT